MDTNTNNATPPEKLTPTQAQQVEKTIQELDEEISEKPKVRGNWLQNLLRAKSFKVGMTVILMFMIFGTALLIAYRTDVPETPVSAENIGIIPEATIIIPQEEEEETEISTQSSEFKSETIPSAI